MHSLNQSRRPSVSIYEYPEDLNPFKDDEMDQVELRKPYIPLNNEKSGTKEHKHKFWTFGKSRKKRSNSFSIKSTWYIINIDNIFQNNFFFSSYIKYYLIYMFLIY